MEESIENITLFNKDIMENAELAINGKCDAVGCTGTQVDALKRWRGSNCTKQAHKSCYQRLLERYNVEPLVDPANGETIIVCSKTCYNKVQKTIVQQPSNRIPWDKDGKDGPNDTNNLLRILLDWLLQEGNYRKFCGGTESKGMRKIDYGKSLSLRMRDAGCRVARSADAVVKKIQELETKFVQAHDWANNTGQGVKEQDGEQTYENLVKQRCKWYFGLLPIMGDRSKATPAVTTDDLLESDVNSALSDSGSDTPAKKKRSTSSVTSRISQKTPPNSTNKKSRQQNTDDQDLLSKYLTSKMESPSVCWGEMARHNRKMEELEERKVKHEEEKVKWSAKEAELTYKKQLMRTKMELEQEGFNKEAILSMFPDMAPLHE